MLIRSPLKPARYAYIKKYPILVEVAIQGYTLGCLLLFGFDLLASRP